MNLRGKVISVDGDKIVIMPDHEDLKVFFNNVFFYLSKFIVLNFSLGPANF